ncbi:MAG: hypothetical protein U0L11_01705 [Acutalibacteraceae bacterium]|nr:hypothetical protein [Acutalibacteraceae bacterium]
MKKLLAILLAASMLFAFAACGGNEEPETTTAPAVEETVEDIFAEPETAAPVEGETAAPVEGETAAPVEGETAAPVEGETAAPAADMDKAAFVAFLNAETAKAAKGSYKYSRTCKYTDPIDVGDSTEALNKVIKMVDENSDLSSVVGGFLGIGTKSGNFPKDEPDEDYRIKATSLKEADLQNFKAENGVYTFTLANAANPKKTGATPLHRFTNDFITHEEVDSSIKDTAGSLITLKSTDVDYTNIKVKVTVAEGKITSIAYQYDFAATLQVKILVGNVNGDGAAITTGQFTEIKY